MNIHYFLIIVLVLSLSLIPSFESAFATSESVFFMKANSTAKLYAELTFRIVEGSWTPYPEVYSYPLVNGNYVNVGSITIRAAPNSFAVTQPNVNVTYTIITKNDTRGTFLIFTGAWGYSYPLVVGLNESEVNPKKFYNFQPINCVFCPSMTTEPPREKVIGYSGLITKIASENSTWINPTHASTWQFFPPPLQQMKQGITFDQIKCSSNFNFLLVIREDHTVEPSCVKSNTMLRLENQGWMTLEKFESMHYPFPYHKPKAMPSETLR